jgi:hypothetical protein
MAEGREFPFGGLTRFLFLPDINILKLTQATRLSQLGSQRTVPVHPPSPGPASFTPNNATGGYRNSVRSASQVVFFFRTSVVIVMKLCD